MLPRSAIALGAGLALLFLLMVGAMAWQEFRQRPEGEPVEYILVDAVRWVLNHLPSSVTLAPAAVTAILEWQIFALQESVKDVARGEASVTMGATDELVAYIAQAADHYTREEVAAVLEAQGGYLLSIGAVSAVVDED